MRGRSLRTLSPGAVLRALPIILVMQVVASQHLVGQVTSSTVAVGGRVLERETGAALEGVSVAIVPMADTLRPIETQITGEGGVFLFQAVSPGVYLLAAALLGYTALGDTLRVEPESELELTLRLSLSPVALQPLVVEAERRPIGPLRGFERRRQTLRGIFLSREDIDASNPQAFTDLLRAVPGARIVPTGAFGHRVFFRGGCVPDLWLDGAPVGMGDIDAFLHPEDLEAVEVYRGPELPGEFGTNLCGAIVAWTRRGDPAMEERSLRRQLIIAGSVVLLFLFSR